MWREFFHNKLTIFAFAREKGKKSREVVVRREFFYWNKIVSKENIKKFGANKAKNRRRGQPWKQTAKADQRVGGESKEIFFFYQFIHS